MTKKATVTQVNWEDDKLGIQQHVVGFACILEQEKYTPNGTSKVYSISAEFGVGKTFFCTKLHDVLKQNGVPVSILNIWEMDFYDNPLVPILIKLQETYDISGTTGKKIPTKLLNWFKSGLSGVSIKANIPKIGEVCLDGKEIVRCNEKLNDKLQESDIYNEYKQFKTELDNLKDFLKDWTKELGKPVVIIIDELDRCRPDYAVKTLEILKHFFDIPGLVFVLAIDEKQLQNSVKTLFGTENFDGYKRKFINNSFILPSPDKAKFVDFLYTRSGLSDMIKQIETNEKDLVFTAHLPNPLSQNYQNIQNFNKTQTCEQIIKTYFTYYSSWFDFKLRHMEQVFDRLTLFTKSILSENELFSPDLAVMLVCLHEFNITIYNAIKIRQYITDTGKSLLGAILDEINKLYDKNYIWEHFRADKNVVPSEVPNINNFSTVGSSDYLTKHIHHNVDRFFKKWDNDNLKWIREEDIHKQKSTICNNHRLIKIEYTDDEIKWGGKKNFDNTSDFDIDAFKQTYFEKMDFIANFK